MLKTNLMYYRIEGMRKEGHELVQWCLKRHVQVPSSVHLKPNLQPIELHIIRVYQSPVENSDEESNSRDHVLRRGCAVEKVLSLSPQDPRRAYRGKGVCCHPILNAWNIPYKGKKLANQYLHFAKRTSQAYRM